MVRLYWYRDWIPEEIKRACFPDAYLRNKRAWDQGYQNKEQGDYKTTLRHNAQGTLSERMLRHRYPQLKLPQPFYVPEGSFTDCDALIPDLRIDVKCKLMRGGLMPRALINKKTHEKKGHLSDYYLITAITKPPVEAEWFYYLGAIKTTRVPRFQLWEKGKVRNITSDCYAVKVDSLKDPDALIHNALKREGLIK